MRNFSHYLPFFMLTAALYAGVFYHHKETTVIAPLPLNSGQQSVQIQFINTPNTSASDKNTEQLKQDNNKPVARKVSSKPQKTKTRKIEKVQEKPQQPSISSHKKSTLEITAVRKKLQKSISKTTAKHDAELKAELFVEQLQQHTRTADISPKSAHKKQTLAEPISSKKLSAQTQTVSTEVIAQRTKKKRVLKKKPTLNNAAAISSAKNSGVLQEALVVSGNIPTYPKRAILRNLQGRVLVQITVSINGTASNSKITTSSGHTILDTAVLNFIARERFMPAHHGTEKVSSQQIFAFRFELK